VVEQKQELAEPEPKKVEQKVEDDAEDEPEKADN